ncbi:MAG: carbohydrate ABC transporter permease [Clostridia bacterium]|nr:carbohydrate ABC transporter permease [Clostridia bacterium]
MKKTKKYYFTQIILIIIMAIICFLWMIPLAYMILSSLRPNSDINLNGFVLFPKVITFDNYVAVFKNTESAPVGKWLFNSLVVSLSAALLMVLISSLSAFAYARMRFKGSKLLFSFLLLTMMIPSVISLIPNFLTIKRLHLNETLVALILPFLGGVTNIFLIRQFLYGVPKELDEAALIDGAGYIKLFFRIILPQMVPILMVVGLNTFLAAWNDLLWPLIINQEASNRTMTSGLSVVQGIFDNKYGTLMAVTVISAVPVLVVYLFVQKYLIRGISLTSGMKE